MTETTTNTKEHTMIELTITSNLYSLLKLETNWPAEHPAAWEAFVNSTRTRRGRGYVRTATIAIDDAWSLAEYLESRCRVRAAYDGDRYQQKDDGTYPGREGAWCAAIARQCEQAQEAR